MLRDAFQYPWATPRGRDALAVCIALVLFALVLARVGRTLWPAWLGLASLGVLLVPALPFAGYLGRVLLASADGEQAPPGFGRPIEAARHGGRVLAVTVAYLVPPAVAFALVAMALGGTADGAGGFEWMLGGTVVLLATVAFAYLLPAALAAAGRDGIRAAFRRGSLAPVGHGAYFVTWMASAVLVVLAWAGLGVAAAASPAGVVAAVWFAYAHVVVARLLGTGLAANRS